MQRLKLVLVHHCEKHVRLRLLNGNAYYIATLSDHAYIVLYSLVSISITVFHITKEYATGGGRALKHLYSLTFMGITTPCLQ